MSFCVRFEREADGRWIAEVPELPGVLAYGADAMQAFDAVLTLAIQVLRERAEVNQDGEVD